MSTLVNHEIVAHSGALVVEKDMDAEVQRLERQAITEESLARQITVQTEEDCERAASEMVRLKTLIQAASERFDPICAATDKAHKEACRQRSLVIGPLQSAVNILSPKVAKFLQAKRDAEEAERRRQIEEARREAELAREREIEQAEAQDCSKDEVQALCDMPLEVQPIIRQTVARPAARVAAVTARSSYKAIVENKLALIQHVARNPQFIELLDVNESNLNRLANSLKTALTLPGVKVINEATAVTRTAPRKG